MSESELKLLYSLRGRARAQVTKTINKSKRLDLISKVEKLQLITKLENLDSDLKKFNKDILTKIWDLSEDEDKIQKEYDECTNYEDKIIEALALIKENVDQCTVSTNPVNNQNLPNHLKPPIVPLPKYSGLEGESLERFLTSFETIINKYNLPSYEKFILLKQQISGRALTLIDSLESSKQSFEDAKNLLVEALASPISQKYEILARLSTLKLTYDMDPYKYISEMRIIKETFNSLKINVNEVLQYFFWDGLNDTFKNQLINITNNNKPCLDEITENMFAATERYNIVTKKFKERKTKNETSKPEKRVTSMATNVNYTKDAKLDFKPCSICSKESGERSDHPIYKCTTYPTSALKLNKIKRNNGCEKCANFNHQAKDCFYKFNSKCRHCQKWHFSFLCDIDSQTKIHTEPNNKQTKSDSKKVSKSGVNNSLVWFTEALPSSSNSDSLLPTFTCGLSGSSVRIMKDSGCQANFITDERAKLSKLKTIKHVQLTINGFNSTQKLNTKIVKVPLKFLSETKFIDAICVPSIKTQLNLNNLGALVSLLKNKGYELADRLLNEQEDVIKNIEIVLGTDSAHYLLETQITFGDPPSLISKTPIGLLLYGNINRAIKNINYLPDNELEKNVSLNFKGTNEIDVNYVVLDEKDIVNESELNKAAKEILDNQCYALLHENEKLIEESSIELNDKLVNFTLNNTFQNEAGRLVMPLSWNGKVSHLLSDNMNLAKQVLNSNRKKLLKTENRIEMVDKVFKEQEQEGIIERIEDLPSFLNENPQCSFIAHMPIVKMERESTKVRNVFLSNLCEKKSNQISLSHNQCMVPGTCLNKKMSTSIIFLRFNSKLLCFDIKKAFLNIELNEVDRNRLLFFWYRNVAQNDFTLTAFRNNRLPFGLVCSPSLLMLALYKILIIDSCNDIEKLKKLKMAVFDLIYMDNGAVTENNENDLRWDYERLASIFDPYRFKLHQYVTNDDVLQTEIDKVQGDITPNKIGFFGLTWNRKEDKIGVKNLKLNSDANTKRLVLQSIASIFDIFNICAPLINRARLFMHSLQMDKSLGWDSVISYDQLKEWKNICKQLNITPEISIPRFIGERNSEYRIVAFSDSSKFIYGVILYIQEIKSNKVSFLLTKNRIVNKQLETKSIPTLEFQAIALGVETLIDTYNQLSGPSCLEPLNISELYLYSDSMVALCWLNSYSHTMEKMNKKSVFIMNRLNHIAKLCETFPITFNFIEGNLNPADFVTRPISFNQLQKTNYFTGPIFLAKDIQPSSLSVMVPNPNTNFPSISETNDVQISLASTAENYPEHLVLLDKYSSFHRLVRVHQYVLRFVAQIRNRLKNKNASKDRISLNSDTNFYKEATDCIIKKEQRIQFPEIINFFESKDKKPCDLPNLVTQLNIFIDDNGILRVKCKFKVPQEFDKFPILI